MFSIVAASFTAMAASGIAAIGFPALGDGPWILSAAAAIIFLGSFEAWDCETGAPATSDAEDF
jgi:hypothetical protein